MKDMNFFNIFNKKSVLINMCVVLFCIFALAGCSGGGEKLQTLVNDNGKIHIICTTFPLYDWTCNIVGENNDRVMVSLLVENGSDVHSYQATAVDIAAISSCDLLIYSGGESEKWVGDAAAQSDNANQAVLNLLEILGDRALIEEEINLTDTDDNGDEPDEEEYDEHVWLSLKNAAILCESIKDALCELEPEKAKSYEQNYEEYLYSLNALDREYEEAVSNSLRKTVLFADRFPFRYLFEDYGLEYYAAFAGCSAETEASFSVIAYLVNKVDEEGLSSLVILEKSDDRIAETIISSTKEKNQNILALDSMQSVNRKDMENGASYLGIMEKNLEVLKEALN
jgi:zinc transport system substrate-binding protein